MTGLTDRITALHEQIDKLTGLVNHMQVKEEGDSTAGSSSSLDAQKKRKLTVKNVRALGSRVIDTVPLQRMSSMDSTMMIGEYEASGEDLPSGPDLLSSGTDFFGNMINPSGADDSPLLLLDDDMDMDVLFTSDSEGDLAVKQEKSQPVADPTPTPINAATLTQNVSKHQQQEYYHSEPISSLPHASAVPMYVPQYQQYQQQQYPQYQQQHDLSAAQMPAVAAIGAVSTAAAEISSVLDSLSPELRLRFVDRLAEVMGAQLTQNISQQVQVQVAQQQQQQQAAPLTPLSHPAPPSSSSYTDASTSTVDQPSPHFMLPSGSRAPEIAIPLASAAIAALLSSMNAFAHNSLQQQAQVPQVAVKDELACK